MEEKGLTTEQIYNADETGLQWKCLPDRTLVSCCEKSAAGFKKSKERSTVLGCTNATGTHKLKPVMIGKFAKPRCFKVLLTENFLFSYLKLYLLKITSAKKFCDLNKTRFFYNFLKTFKFAAILHSIRLSLLSEYDVL